MILFLGFDDFDHAEAQRRGDNEDFERGEKIRRV
jgi:hypothetical protein